MNKPTKISTQSIAASYLDALVDRGIKHVFANAGTDFAPIIEAMVAASKHKKKLPRFHTVPHENLAVAMAHGYYLSSGEPSAVMVHVTVGTANALCGIMNASRDNAPILLAAGRTPNTETGHAGSRNASIHWGQDSFDQGGMLREYVKWDYELRAGQEIETIVGRALDIAMSEPRGPVYLAMPREILGDPAKQEVKPPRSRPLGSVPATPSAAAIEETAKAIADAEFPLIITASLGRDHDNVGRLSSLVEEFGIGVALPGEPGAREVNLPSSHPMFLGTHPNTVIERADVIIAIDCEVPWWPRYVSPKKDAKLIHISADPFFSNYPLRGFEMDIAISGSSTQALQMLHNALQVATKGKDKNIEARRKEISRLSQIRRDEMKKTIDEVSGLTPIHPAWIAACVNKVKKKNTIIVNELGVPMDLLDLQEPGSYISSSLAGGLGFGLGASLGAKLGSPDRDVILIVGDGSYMFGNPVPAHFVSRADKLPTLTIVLNNHRWHAVHRSTLGMYPDGLASKEEVMPLVELGPSPDFEQIIKSCGGYGERVDNPADLVGALERGLAAVSSGKSALLNIITGYA